MNNLPSDQRLRALMDEADPAMFVPGFDLDQSWEQTRRQIAHPSRSLQLLRIGSYAAVFVVGFLLAVLCLPDKEQPVSTTGKMVKQQPKATVADVPHKVATVATARKSVRPVQSVPSPASRRVPATSLASPVPGPVLIKEEAVVAVADGPEVTPSAPEVMAETLPVRHYFDLPETAPLPVEATVVVRKSKSLRGWLTRRREAPYVQTREALPLKGVFYALNQ